MSITGVPGLFTRLLILTGLAVSSSILAHSQEVEAAPEPAFEVVSLRPMHFTPGCYSMLPPETTHYGVTCITLRELIARAWKVHPDNIQGGSSQALDATYSISAVIPNPLRWNQDNVRPMLRQMLEERLHVAVRRGTKQVSGYVLIVSRTGSKLKPARENVNLQGHRSGQSFSNAILPGHIRGRDIDLNGLAALLSSVEGYPVIDRTGLAGNYDVDLYFAKNEDSDSDWPSISIALDQQLGLELRGQKVTIATLIVDHADKEPTPN